MTDLAAALRAVTGAALAHDFEPFWPYSPASRAIVFERAVSHGRGRPRTFDKLRVLVDPATGRIEKARLVVNGAESFAEDQDARHAFDVIDALLLTDVSAS